MRTKKDSLKTAALIAPVGVPLRNASAPHVAETRTPDAEDGDRSRFEAALRRRRELVPDFIWVDTKNVTKLTENGLFFRCDLSIGVDDHAGDAE